MFDGVEAFAATCSSLFLPRVFRALRPRQRHAFAQQLSPIRNVALERKFQCCANDELDLDS